MQLAARTVKSTIPLTIEIKKAAATIRAITFNKFKKVSFFALNIDQIPKCKRTLKNETFIRLNFRAISKLSLKTNTPPPPIKKPSFKIKTTPTTNTITKTPKSAIPNPMHQENNKNTQVTAHT
jgi:hypothetical protein